jgi:hypothetical protein
VSEKKDGFRKKTPEKNLTTHKKDKGADMFDEMMDDEWDEIMKKPWYAAGTKRQTIYVIQPKKILSSGMGLRVFTSVETPQKEDKINKM